MVFSYHSIFQLCSCSVPVHSFLYSCVQHSLVSGLLIQFILHFLQTLLMMCQTFLPENHILEVEMGETRETNNGEVSQSHTGGGGVQEECDTVKDWSRDKDPFLLVTRFFIEDLK